MNTATAKVLDINTRQERPTLHLAPITNLLPAIGNVLVYETKEEHDAQPLKDRGDINNVIRYYLNHGQYRRAMMFTVGINLGLRISDLLRLRFCDFIDGNGYFKDELVMVELKTEKRRKTVRNRHMYINDAVRLAIAKYVSSTQGLHADDYLFAGDGNRCSKTIDGVRAPMDKRSYSRILKDVTGRLGIVGRYSSHALRKTFCYHMLSIVSDEQANPRSLQILQSILGHSDPRITMHYSGITDTETRTAYMKLNLGVEVYRQDEKYN